MTPSEVVESAQALSKQSLAVLFFSLVIVFGFCVVLTIRWLLTQLERQRTAHMQAQDKLLDYMARDHQQLAALQSQTNMSLTENAEALRDIRQLLRDQAFMGQGKKLHHSIRQDPRKLDSGPQA